MAKRVGKQTVSLPYKDGLNIEERKRYEAKLMIIGGCDPYEEKLTWTRDVNMFPSVTYPDIVNYLLFTPSAYSADDLKAYKSLEAYNQFVCGWVRETEGRVHGDHVIVSAKVLHSQRMREKLLRPWIIAKKDGKIVAAHCNCIAGLGEACSHIAALLFYTEAAVKIRDSKTVTEEKAYWLLPSACKSIEYKEVREISFMSARTAKKQLDNRIEAASSATPVTPGTSSARKRTVPVATNEDFLLFCGELNNLTSKPALLSIIEPYADKYVPKPDLKEFPMIMTKLRDENCDTMNYKDLTDKCANITVICSKQQAENVEEETRGQAKSKLWHRFRAGRITASKAKAVCSTSKASPSQSLIKEVCYPGEKHFQTDATKWGCDHEKEALNKFMEEIGQLHENSRLQKSGFIISQEIPYIGASPDGLFMCDCCGPACIEVKCPFNVRYDDINEDSINFLHRENGKLKLKQDHPYYFQMQTQLGVSKHEVGYFVVWTVNSVHIEAVMFDSEVWTKICASAKDIMYGAVLQEVVGKFFSRLPSVTPLPERILKSVENTPIPKRQQMKNCDKTEELFCYCNQVEHGRMIACDNEACEIEWFHYSCVNIENAPKGKWYCPDCRKLQYFKRKRLNSNKAAKVFV